MTRNELLIAVALSVAGLAVSAIAAVTVVVRLPADYFLRTDRVSLFPDRPRWFRHLARVAKNLIGATLVVLGIVLSVPGVPGQGLLTILVGLMLLDLPGKRRLERRILLVGGISRGVDRLRARFGRPPLETGSGPRSSDETDPAPR